MKLENLNTNIPFTKTDGTIFINPKDWQDNTTQIVQSYNLKGEHTISNINKVLKTNYDLSIYKEYVQEGDLVFITRQASRVSYLNPYKIAGLEGEFANVHLLQLAGKFKNNVISYENFIPLYNKVFMKKLLSGTNSILDLGDNNKTIVGEVLKVGTNGFDENWKPVPLTAKVGQKVLVRDNSYTEITLDGEDYIVTEDSFIVGYFEGEEISLSTLKLFNEFILLEKEENKNIEGSSLLIKPDSVGDSLSDINEFYNNNQFNVLVVGDKIKKIKSENKIVVSEDFLNYVTINGIKYYLLEGTKYVYGIYK